MNKVLYDENGKAYSVDDFDRLVNGGFIKETDFVEELRKGVEDRKELISENCFQNGIISLTNNNSEVYRYANIDMGSNIFYEKLNNGELFPSKKVADIIINNSTPLKRRVDIAIAMEIAKNKTDILEENTFRIYKNGSGVYVGARHFDLISSISTTMEIAEDIARKLNEGYR